MRSIEKVDSFCGVHGTWYMIIPFLSWRYCLTLLYNLLWKIVHRLVRQSSLFTWLTDTTWMDCVSQISHLLLVHIASPHLLLVLIYSISLLLNTILFVGGQLVININFWSWSLRRCIPIYDLRAMVVILLNASVLLVFVINIQPFILSSKLHVFTCFHRVRPHCRVLVLVVMLLDRIELCLLIPSAVGLLILLLAPLRHLMGV
jgi:hypothetical protein